MSERVLPLAQTTTMGLRSSSPDTALMVKVGESFVVTLPENGGSTGYIWSLSIDKTDTVSFREKNLDLPQIPIPGAPGTAHFRFDALKPGTTTIIFELRQPWQSKDVAAETYTIEITVSA